MANKESLILGSDDLVKLARMQKLSYIAILLPIIGIISNIAVAGLLGSTGMQLNEDGIAFNLWISFLFAVTVSGIPLQIVALYLMGKYLRQMPLTMICILTAFFGPPIGLILFIILHRKTFAALRSGGYKVGLLGVELKPNEWKSLQRPAAGLCIAIIILTPIVFLIIPKETNTESVTVQDTQATLLFAQKLSPLLPPPSDSSRTPDEKYRLCIETAQREFGLQTTEEQRKSVCHDYAYTTAEQADVALRQMFDEVVKVPVAERGAWCLENGPYLFPEEKNMHLRCVVLVEHWDEFWKAMREGSAKKVQELYR